MCRILAMLSEVPGELKFELTAAPNNFCTQSYLHPDGWGVAHFASGLPEIVKSIRSAHSDSLFDTVARVVRSTAWVAHLRRATCGGVKLENAHPFNVGEYVFAHNGHIRDFENVRRLLMPSLDADFLNRSRGDTDSEFLFHVLMSGLKSAAGGSGATAPEVAGNEDRMAAGLLEAIARIEATVGGFSQVNCPEDPTTQFTFVLASAGQLYAYNGGKAIYYKVKEHNPFSVIVASEVIGSEGGWTQIPFSSLLVVKRSSFFLTARAAA